MGWCYEIQGVFVYQDFRTLPDEEVSLFGRINCEWSGRRGQADRGRIDQEDGVKYMDKFVQVKGMLKTGSHSKTGDSVTVTGSGNKFITCVLASGEFPKVLKGGRGVEIEIKEISRRPDSISASSSDDRTVVNCKPASPLRVRDIFPGIRRQHH